MENSPLPQRDGNGGKDGPIEVEAVPIEPGYAPHYRQEGEPQAEWADDNGRGQWSDGGGFQPRVIRIPGILIFLPVLILGLGLILLFKVFGLFLLLMLGVIVVLLRLNTLRIAVAQWLIRRILAKRGMR